MKRSWVPRFMIALFVLPLIAHAQTASSGADAAAACPVEFRHFDPSGVNARVRNVSGKRIVGLVFHVALADAAEHWKWLHWNFDLTRPLREFNWNQGINAGDTKKLSWGRADLDFEHGGGGAFVLTSVLFADGSSWEEGIDSAQCTYIWYSNHKKGFSKPVQLPPRE